MIAFVLFLLMLAGLLLIAVLFGTGRSQKEAVANKDALLAEIFDGREQVMFEGKLVGLPADVVMEHAAEYGYRCVSVSEKPGLKTLIFERRS